MLGCQRSCFGLAVLLAGLYAISRLDGGSEDQGGEIPAALGQEYAVTRSEQRPSGFIGDSESRYLASIKTRHPVPAAMSVEGQGRFW